MVSGPIQSSRVPRTDRPIWLRKSTGTSLFCLLGGTKSREGSGDAEWRRRATRTSRTTWDRWLRNGHALPEPAMTGLQGERHRVSRETRCLRHGSPLPARQGRRRDRHFPLQVGTAAHSQAPLLYFTPHASQPARSTAQRLSGRARSNPHSRSKHPKPVCVFGALGVRNNKPIRLGSQGDYNLLKIKLIKFLKNLKIAPKWDCPSITSSRRRPATAPAGTRTAPCAGLVQEDGGRASPVPAEQRRTEPKPLLSGTGPRGAGPQGRSGFRCACSQSRELRQGWCCAPHPGVLALPGSAQV